MRIALVCTAALFGSSLHAQTARVLGQVTDAQGAVVPHVRVQITNLDTGTVINTESSDSGEYSAQFLPAGNYKITVEAPG
ncbi:MAG TPA: carboxypeptidase-like regulatory domain-containing protein, partial [Acidobacteriaceae bacterium]